MIAEVTTRIPMELMRNLWFEHGRYVKLVYLARSMADFRDVSVQQIYAT